MKSFLLSCICVLAFKSHAQEILEISPEQAEAIFLENNLLLISENLHIEQQKAEVIQARLWPNPSFSISEINAWASRKQTGGQEVSPPFWNDFGKNQQIAFEIEQLIQTAGKRKKLIALEQVDVSISEQYFEDLLRGLKLELRKQLTDLQFTQYSIQIHKQLIENISKLSEAYRIQLEQGNISKNKYIRLKAQELQISQEVLKLTQESNQLQKELKLLLRIQPMISLKITDEGFIKNTEPYQNIFIDQILQSAKEYRPDYQLALLEEKYHYKLLDYEKAQRTPDLTFGVNYDRNGNTMLDFVGFGVSFDLPFFNRNKGNIQKAKLGIEKAQFQKEQILLTIENEVFLAYQSLQESISFISNIPPHYEQELDELLERYTQNLIARNISMVEYFDFIDAYLENKKIILHAQKEVNQKAEELHYTLGKEL